MRVPLRQVDAFTGRPFHGNPAAVCLLGEARDEGWMQSVAAEMNLSETAFLVRRPRDSASTDAGEGDFDLRWFTPTAEVDLCGHATLASAHVLWEDGVLPAHGAARFHTRSGVLGATRRADWIELDTTLRGLPSSQVVVSAHGDLIELDFPATPAHSVAPPPELLLALGVEAEFVGTNGSDYLVVVADEDVVRGARPRFDLLTLATSRGVIVTARSRDVDFDFISRFFAPAVGINEDPVTGSAHCTLGPYWADRLGKTDLVGFQASLRGGVVWVRLDFGRIKLGGQAVTTLRGELCC